MATIPNANGDLFSVAPAPFHQELDADIQANDALHSHDNDADGSIGTTMFDQPGSEDNTITVLLPGRHIQAVPSQALVRIKSRSGGDGREYLGIVTAGPFAEPDSLRADSHLLVTVATRGGNYQPPFHGRVQVAILGQLLGEGALGPPRLRPLPNSLVFALSEEESARYLKAEGAIRLGVAVGYEKLAVGIPPHAKAVFPRHTAILGTTGGGKSNTVARLVQQAQEANMAVVLLDVEGEYTKLHNPTTHKEMVAALAERGLKPRGIPAEAMTVYHLVGRDTTNPDHPHLREFSLQFARLSPYAACEILGLSDAQEQRFHRAYDMAKEVLRELNIFPKKGDEEQERLALEIDEFERGYPRLTLSLFIDIVSACETVANLPKKAKDAGESSVALQLYNSVLKAAKGKPRC